MFVWFLLNIQGNSMEKGFQLKVLEQFDIQKENDTILNLYRIFKEQKLGIIGYMLWVSFTWDRLELQS